MFTCSYLYLDYIYLLNQLLLMFSVTYTRIPEKILVLNVYVERGGIILCFMID
jgi:hypothetical protein